MELQELSNALGWTGMILGIPFLVFGVGYLVKRDEGWKARQEAKPYLILTWVLLAIVVLLLIAAAWTGEAA